MSLNSDYIALSPISLKAPIGWKIWKSLVPNVLDSGVHLPYGKIHSSYLPTQVIWVDAEVANCVINLPFSFRDPYEEFIGVATLSGSLDGALTGLELAKSAMDEQQSITYSLSDDAPPAKISYCIGNLFKEEVYTNISATKIQFPVGVVAEVYEDIICRSRFKRIYITHGEIQNISSYVDPHTGLLVPRKYILDIGVSNKLNDIFNSTYVTDKKIKIIQGNILIDMKVVQITKNFEFVVEYYSPAIAEIPSIGNYFYFPLSEATPPATTGLCIEDPYLIDGFWRGAESEGNSGEPLSGYNYYCTSTNSPYTEGVFTGMYLTVDNAGNPILPQNSDLILDGSDFKWQFYPFPFTSNANDPPAYTKNEIYGDDKKRYEIYEVINSNRNSSIDSKEIPLATQNTFTNFLKLPGLKSLRLEISKGGRASRNNFHYPCLKSQYLKNNNTTFKILNQIDATTIDVNIDSVNGTKLINSVTGELISYLYGIYNQYAWCFNEYYMSKDRNQIFTGNITGVVNVPPTPIVLANTPVNTPTTTQTNYEYDITFTIDEPNSSTLVDLPQKSFQPLYLKPKSFFNRFMSEHVHTNTELQKLYNKGQNWKLYINYISYSIESVQFTLISGNKYTAKFRIKSLYILDLTIIGKQSYVTFDIPFEKQGSFNGSLNVEAKLGGGTSVIDTKLCLSGYWISPQIKIDISSPQYIGICDGNYFGVTNEIANRNDLATIFVTTPGGVLCSSSAYDKIKNNETIFYNDAYSRRITARMGDIGFYDHPRKVEITVGESEFKETTGQSGTIINPNISHERVKTMEFKVGNSPAEINSTNNKPLLFGIGKSDNYYGIPISGFGKMSLKLFDVLNSSMSPPNSSSVSTIPSNYKFNNYVVSPIYSYLRGQYSAETRLTVPLSTPTQDGSIYTSLSISDAKFEYVKNNQTLRDIGYFNTHLLNNGEFIVVYGNITPSFTLTNGTSTFKNNYKSSVTPSVDKIWKYTTNSVFVVGSGNGGYSWGTPSLLKPYGDSQYSLCLINSVDYLTSIVDNTTLYIFIKCYTNTGKNYLGMYSMPLNRMAYKSYKCVFLEGSETDSSGTRDSTETPMNFNFRPPAMKTDNFDGASMNTQFVSSFCPASNIVDDGFDWVSQEGEKDFFSRVIGDNIYSEFLLNKPSIDSTIFNYESINIYMSPAGHMILTFSAQSGVRALFSVDHGVTWKLSSIILAKSASSGLIIDGQLFYVTGYGIETKFTNGVSLFNLIRAVNTGDNQAYVEEIQSEMDNFSKKLIYQGLISSQRLSGYASKDGFLKVFFYNNDTTLSCIQGSGLIWNMANNF